MKKFCITFHFVSGAIGVAAVKDGCFAMLLLEGKPGDQVVAKQVMGFDTEEDARAYLDDMYSRPEGKKLLDVFENRIHITPGDEILVH